MLKPGLFLFLIAFLFSSCVTILNRKQQRVVVYTKQPASVIYNQDTIHTKDNKAQLHIKRKNKIVKLQVVSAERQEAVTLYPHISSAFWWNLPCSYGVGMLVDMWSSKTWAYPTKIYVGSYDSSLYRHRYEVYHNQTHNVIKSYFSYDPPHKKGELYMHLSLPHINYFDFSHDGEPRKENIGFIGISSGLNYYHARNQFLSLNFSVVLNSVVPFPAPVDHFGLRQDLQSTSITLSNNHKLKRLSLGYGISAAKNNWQLSYRAGYGDSIPPAGRLYANKTHYAFGAVVPVYFQVSNYFHTGLVYRPTFYRPNLPDKFKYEHLMSIDFAWKFRIKK